MLKLPGLGTTRSCGGLTTVLGTGQPTLCQAVQLTTQAARAPRARQSTMWEPRWCRKGGLRTPCRQGERPCLIPRLQTGPGQPHTGHFKRLGGGGLPSPSAEGLTSQCMMTSCLDQESIIIPASLAAQPSPWDAAQKSWPGGMKHRARQSTTWTVARQRGRPSRSTGGWPAQRRELLTSSPTLGHTTFRMLGSRGRRIPSAECLQGRFLPQTCLALGSTRQRRRRGTLGQRIAWRAGGGSPLWRMLPAPGSITRRGRRGMAPHTA
mmetsp:Transcript_9573/g.27396  ORF Transcript_9573/g.27396 Transcript_9573/m.27396 type:complete len:265 (-) Transcript_9573:1663-2457(-)